MLVSPEDPERGNEVVKSKRISSRQLRKLPFETYLELISCPPNKMRYHNQIASECQVRYSSFT